MCSVVEVLSNYFDYYLRLLGFPDLFGKVSLITFKFSIFEFPTTLLQKKHKQNSLIISSFIMQRDYSGYNYHIFLLKFIFLFIRAVKSKKKKLTLTLLCLSSSRNMPEQTMKIYLHKPIKIL